ncbi:MAG: RNA polymerase factor sigma-54 [Gammaproteobacteria bacterium]|nr:RNA polymerase factor sigma-54 [Gammaproteobacteria bacterium]
MKQTLEIKLGQKLAMTPQLQQAIRLLQLSVIDLRIEIQLALDNNPMLDTADNNDATQEPEEPDDEEAFNNNEKLSSSKNEPTVAKETDDVFEQGTAGDELKEDYTWDDESYIPRSTSSNNRENDWSGIEVDNRNSTPTTLHDHLEWQMRMLSLSSRDQMIAGTIIEAVSDDGYLTLSIEDVTRSLDAEPAIEQDEVMAMLHQIQNFDPVGVAAVDIADSLQIQLKQLPDDTPYRSTAMIIVDKHLDLVAHRDLTKLKRILKGKTATLSGAIALIQSLNPRPGSIINPSETRYIIPDISVKKINGRWRARLNEDAIPKLEVNRYYQSLIKRGDNSTDNRYLKENLQEARWYIKSLQNRHDTLLNVANEIIKRQQDFFEHGDESMKPMVLHDIADALELHESTISRVTTNKYMQTHMGVFELKYFFSSHVSTVDGGTCSATAIRSQIKKLVNNEPIGKPISDNRIAELLSQQGMCVARRTVAKYRELMHIPPSNLRKSLTL